MRRTVHITKIGETRIKRKFALLPIRIGSDWRWLEWVWVKQRFYHFYDGSFWEDEEFVEAP